LALFFFKCTLGQVPGLGDELKTSRRLGKGAVWKPATSKINDIVGKSPPVWSKEYGVQVGHKSKSDHGQASWL